MNQAIVPSSGPKLKLVESAEKLFAEKGFDLVSVRDVTQAAGSNAAAVHYYFGSRDGLVALVMCRYMTPVNEERLARLEAAERNRGSRPVPLEEVLDAYVRPLITQINKSEMSERLFCVLIGRIFGSQGHAMPPDMEAQRGVLIERFTEVLGKSLLGLTPEELAWRLHFTVGAMIHMLTHGEELQRLTQGAAGTPTMDVTLARFLRFAAAGLREGVEVEVAMEEERDSPQAMFNF
jgi:AcrR family transcriptional regulator